MKRLVSILVLVLAPGVFAARVQAASPEPAPQANRGSAHSTSSKATSHNRHLSKHRASNQHHRPRVTAKSHNS